MHAIMLDAAHASQWQVRTTNFSALVHWKGTKYGRAWAISQAASTCPGHVEQRLAILWAPSLFPGSYLP